MNRVFAALGILATTAIPLKSAIAHPMQFNDAQMECLQLVGKYKASGKALIGWITQYRNACREDPRQTIIRLKEALRSRSATPD